MIRGIWTAFTVAATAFGIIGFLLWLGLANGRAATIVAAGLSVLVTHKAVVRIRRIPVGAAWGLTLFFGLSAAIFLALFIMAALS